MNTALADMKAAKDRAARAAYMRGWSASERTATYDIDAAQGRYVASQGDTYASEFIMGWTDYASSYEFGYSL